METIKLWPRHGDAVRQAIEWGELVHLETASEAWTDALLLCALHSGLLAPWAEACPAPRGEPESSRAVLLASPLAARCAGRSARRQSGSVRRAASGLGALGESVAVLAPAPGLAVRGPSDATRISGDVLRQRLVKLAKHVALHAPLRWLPCAPSPAVTGRQRAARRAVQGAVDEVEAAARAQRVAAQLMEWENDPVGPALLASARVGPGRRRPSVDTTPVAVPLETGPSECRGVVQNDAGSRSRGYTLATVRTWWDHAGRLTQVGLGPMHGHAVPVWRRWFETAPGWSKGEV